MPRHDQPRCRIPVGHAPHPSGIDRQARGDWCPGLPGDPGDTVPLTAERAELLGLGVMVTVLERMTTDERRRSLAYLRDRFAPAPIGEWVLAACGHLWREPRPPGLTFDTTAPRVCGHCPAEHPAAVGASPDGLAVVPVTYHHERPGTDE